MSRFHRLEIALVVVVGLLCLASSLATGSLVPGRGVEASAPSGERVVLARDAVSVLNELESEMLDAHNSIRSASKIAPLEPDAALTEVARERAADMASKGYFAHVSPKGQTAFTLLSALNYRYVVAAENIARNNYAPAESVSVAMDGFMNSASHRENILDARLRYVGVGSAIGDDGMLYYAVVFAAR